MSFRYLHAGIGAGIHFTCSSSQGAILLLPDGASRVDLRNLKKFRSHAAKNALAWYEYVNGSLGREAANGSLYLVTGCDKATSWGVASFSHASKESGVSLKFTAAKLVEGSASYAYSWETYSPAAVRTGPKRGTVAHDQPQNQCAFIRGFKLSVREGVFAPLKGAAKVSSVLDSPNDSGSGQQGGYIPFAGGSKSSIFHKRTPGGGSRGQQRPNQESDSPSEPEPPAYFDEQSPQYASRPGSSSPGAASDSEQLTQTTELEKTPPQSTEQDTRINSRSELKREHTCYRLLNHVYTIF